MTGPSKTMKVNGAASRMAGRGKVVAPAQDGKKTTSRSEKVAAVKKGEEKVV